MPSFKPEGGPEASRNKFDDTIEIITIHQNQINKIKSKGGGEFLVQHENITCLSSPDQDIFNLESE